MISPSTMASESGSETPKLTRRSPERSCASSTTLIELDPMSSPTVVFFLPNMAAPSVGRDWRAPRYPRAAVRAHYFEQVPCHGSLALQRKLLTHNGLRVGLRPDALCHARCIPRCITHERPSLSRGNAPPARPAPLRFRTTVAAPGALTRAAPAC